MLEQTRGGRKETRKKKRNTAKTSEDKLRMGLNNAQSATSPRRSERPIGGWNLGRGGAVSKGTYHREDDLEPFSRKSTIKEWEKRAADRLGLEGRRLAPSPALLLDLEIILTKEVGGER